MPGERSERFEETGGVGGEEGGGRGGRRRRRQLRQVGVDSKKVDGGGVDDREERKPVRASSQERTTLINIHDEIYPSIITDPEIYARSAVSDRGVAPPGATAPRLSPRGYIKYQHRTFRFHLDPVLHQRPPRHRYFRYR